MARKYLMGYDVGSSSVKACLVDVETGESIASAFFPSEEAPIKSEQSGWAEQEPNAWWNYLKEASCMVMNASGAKPEEVSAIGVSYQMHGLVCIDKKGLPLRPAIIWCDSRAVHYGEKAMQELGEKRCLSHLLNSPGNFTASKLAWVKENEPGLYEKIHRIMLPGDYIIYRMTGVESTTVSGLSEAMLWDFNDELIANFVMDYWGFDHHLIPEIVPSFSEQGRLTEGAAKELGLLEGTPVTYRGGDQPNNAMSLGVLHPGEIAATAGTSGVIYGVTDKVNYDERSRVNTFAHVNHSKEMKRLGILLCINGTGILNAWLKRITGATSYDEMNTWAQSIQIGADGLSVLPFGNGAERCLENKNIGSSFHGIDLNRHGRGHLARAVQEGIVFSFKYGIDVMKQMGFELGTIRAGRANMFLSELFRDTLAGVTDSLIEMYETDGAAGAARGAGIGAAIYANEKEAFGRLKRVGVTEPSLVNSVKYSEAYEKWKESLGRYLK